MEDIDHLKNHIRLAAIDSLPKVFIEELIKRAEMTYAQCYADLKDDPLTLPEQRSAKLKDDRFYRMERELSEAAKKHGLAITARALPENTHHFVYVVSGVFGLTQSYVQAMGEMPNPAKFRESLSSAAAIPRLPIDDLAEIYSPRKFYGLFAHNPIGKRFDDELQKLGTIQLCVPFPEMSGWADEISLNELLSLYPADATIKKVAERAPTWKVVPAKKDADES